MVESLEISGTLEIPKPLGAGETQELDEIRRALEYRFR